LCLCTGRFGPPPQGAEEINFPTGAGAHIVECLVALVPRQMPTNATDWAVERLAQRCDLSGQIARRQALRARCSGSRTGLIDPRERGCQIEILIQRTLHDTR